MNTPYFKLTPISEVPKKEDTYFVVREKDGDKNIHSFHDGAWDMWAEAGEYTHYLAPLAEQVEGMNFLSVLQENYEAVKSGDANVLFPDMDNKAAVLETYEDLISIYNAKLSSTPSARESELEREVERLRKAIKDCVGWFADHAEFEMASSLEPLVSDLY